MRRGLLTLTLTAVVLGAVPALAAAAVTPVSVFPIPGSRYNRPATQISLRGVAPTAIGPVTVVGSRSGPHLGRLRADSDQSGASFVPSRPFLAGEQVTVRTRLSVLGAHAGRWSFGIANPAALITCARLPSIPRLAPGDLQSFRSRPDLRPAALTVTTDRAPAAEGDIFLGPQNGPVQNGPMILDPHGGLVWFWPMPVSRRMYANNVQVQDLGGHPVLTWWQGCRASAGLGRGVDLILNRGYRVIDTVRAANGVDADSHEFLLTPQGDAYLTANSPVWVPGVGIVVDWIVQEIDVRTGLVLFDWHALDHVALGDSFAGQPDPYHLNSISLAPDGNLVVSMRNTSALYEIDHRSGQILWTLGGKASSFAMGAGTEMTDQHDAVVAPDGTITVFDNAGGPPFAHQSRAIRLRLDTHAMTATLEREYDHSPPLYSIFEGSMQLLADGDAFLGWGGEPYFSEYDAAGRQILDAHFRAPIRSYRADRAVWTGQPSTAPALVATASGRGAMELYVSWNGATTAVAWRVLAGTGTRRLKVVKTAPWSGFETVVRLRLTTRYLAVQALDAHGRTLSTSREIRAPS